MMTPKCPNSWAMKITADTSSDNPFDFNPSQHEAEGYDEEQGEIRGIEQVCEHRL